MFFPEQLPLLLSSESLINFLKKENGFVQILFYYIFKLFLTHKIHFN